jgi:uncharacterized protein YjbI with pentapeptide repeats
MKLPDLADLPYAAALTRDDVELDGSDFDMVLFEDAEFDGPRAANTRFLECAFRRVSISDGKLQRSSLRGVWARDLRLTSTSLAESHWHEVIMLGSALAGVEVFSAELRNVVFSGCKLDAVNFRASRLTEVVFENCVLRDADFAGATLKRCSFPGSQLVRADLSKVTMDRTDLRTAELGLIIDADSLRGAIISSGQLAYVAPVLAQTLGIEINDEPV